MTRPHKNALEWIVFAISACIVAATIGYLAYGAIRETSSPPDLRISHGAPAARGGAFLVPLMVRNVGNETAEQVKVEVVLRRGGEEVERAELDLMFVPRKSEREGWVTFRHDPRCCAIETRAVGFEKP